MRQVIILFIWGLCSTRIIAQGYDHWNFLRYSAVMANDSLKVRVEDNAPVNKPHSIIFRGQSTFIERPMNGVVDAGATYEASVPTPIADTSFLGLRLVDSNQVHLIPPYFKGSEMPALSELIQMSSDVAGDDLFKLNFLDIAADFVACSREKLFYGLRNAGGGFPVMEGFTFYSYLGAIINPDDQSEKPIVFCLIYTINQPGMITPGLYRIMGSGLGDLIKIGEIETRIAPNENLIIMSCRLKDLYNDPYFKTWYQPENPRFSIAAITQRISLVEGTKEADRSSGATLYPRALPIGPFTNQLPQLSNAQVTQVEGENLLEIRYFDPNTNFPLTAEVIFDDETTHRYLLFPLSLDYRQPVTYRTAKGNPILLAANWKKAKFRFSDNNLDFVEQELANGTAVSTVPQIPLQWQLWPNYPNPFNPQTTISFVLAEHAPVNIGIYNLQGALATELFNGQLPAGPHSLIWNATDFPAGTYFIQMQVKNRIRRSKCLLLK